MEPALPRPEPSFLGDHNRATDPDGPAPRTTPAAIGAGTLVEGTVSGITHFGAFVSLDGGLSGLIHISEIAYQYVRNVREHLQVGQRIRVKVLQLNPTSGKYDLSLKRTAEAPSDEAAPAWRRGRKQRTLAEGADLAFEEKLTRFRKSSEERLLDLRRNIDAKRGGRFRRG